MTELDRDIVRNGNIQRTLVRRGKKYYVPTFKFSWEISKKYRELIKAKWEQPHYFFTGKPGGHVTALRHHIRHRFFAVLDFKDYFETITDTKVYRSLRRIGLNHQQAYKIAGESTVRYNDQMVLARGLPQSSLIADVVLDKSLVGSVIKNKIKSAISVYCDDIILSSNSSEQLQNDVDLLLEAMVNAHFDVNLQKSHYPRESATLFNINISHENLYFTEYRMTQFQVKSDSFFAFVIRSEVLKSLKFVDQMLAYISSINAIQGERFEAWLYTNPIYEYYKTHVNKKDYRKWKVVRKDPSPPLVAPIKQSEPGSSRLEKLTSWITSKINN